MSAVNLHKVENIFFRSSFTPYKPTHPPKKKKINLTISFSLRFPLCRLDFRPGRGLYDLQIKNTSYNRDNGRFECRIKAKGTGADVHQEFYNVTVLTAPHPPMVTPGNIAVATEEKPLELTCSSIGGSPDPTIT